MPPQCLTLKYTGRAVALASQIRVCAAFDAPDGTQIRDLEALGAREFSAIWDTGATNTVISQKVVQECGLKPIGIVQLRTANGPLTTETYLAALFLPNYVFSSRVKVSTAPLLDTDVLIGMDIITSGDFAITNMDGHTTFSFRNPSTEIIDFVKMHPPGGLEPQRKIGRNEPCPCGSGKKYKLCHGR